jgi:hypothetical protein
MALKLYKILSLFFHIRPNGRIMDPLYKTMREIKKVGASEIP